MSPGVLSQIPGFILRATEGLAARRRKTSPDLHLNIIALTALWRIS